jgi:antitoxin component YwqK of YwqJK toxin-antitoxin module
MASMQRINFLMFLIIAVSISCSSKVNQLKNKKKQGKWVYRDSIQVSSKGRYSNDLEVGTWKFFSEGKLFRKERYKSNSVSIIKFYHPNGRVSACGLSRSDLSSKDLHWYMFGDWKYYNEKGKLIEMRFYEHGAAIKSTKY